MATALAHSSISVVLLVSSDPSFRQSLRSSLTGLRWQVLEARGGAEAMGLLGDEPAHAVILDSWLPDLDVEELARELSASFPTIDLISMDGSAINPGVRSPRRGELLHALRLTQENGQEEVPASVSGTAAIGAAAEAISGNSRTPRLQAKESGADATLMGWTCQPAAARANPPDSVRLPEFIGTHCKMLEVSRRIRLVAPRKASVLVQGPTGTGKELVARALHRLSPRAHRPFVALNCAAIPESLLEAELFGHARGAFTGAVQRRVGRIEAAEGGTLFLDEIGEMPLALQSKLLRFLESGELQRVGENETVHVDVRVVAATHQPLAARAREGSFRADLFYRLAVFLIATPLLAEHAEDVPLLAEHFLARIGQTSAAKRFTSTAMEALQGYSWPGNVRELEHVIERAYILAEDRYEIDAAEIEFGDAA